MMLLVLEYVGNKTKNLKFPAKILEFYPLMSEVERSKKIRKCCLHADSLFLPLRVYGLVQCYDVTDTHQR